MTDSDILTVLKTDLEIAGTGRDTLLNNLIALAKKAISREGITLDSSSTDDGMLVEMYAAHLYRKRRTDGTGKYKSESYAMSRPLRYMLNNRLLQEKCSLTPPDAGGDGNG